MEQNPKLQGTNIVDAIPQTGKCPGGCEACFYNYNFFRTLDEPLIPTLEESKGKIIRINSGHDSNIQKDLVLKTTEQYEHKFYNTSIVNFDFPSPVVFTANGGNGDLKLIYDKNIMFVRVRTNSWDLEIVDKAVDFYLIKHNIPVVLTFMRYYNGKKVAGNNDYEWKKHILNEYFCLRQETILRILKRYEKTGVRTCGNNVSNCCLDCRNCEFLYWEHLRRNK